MLWSTAARSAEFPTAGPMKTGPSLHTAKPLRALHLQRKVSESASVIVYPYLVPIPVADEKFPDGRKKEAIFGSSVLRIGAGYRRNKELDQLPNRVQEFVTVERLPECARGTKFKRCRQEIGADRSGAPGYRNDFGRVFCLAKGHKRFKTFFSWHKECVIRRKAATHSDGKRPPIPTEGGHRFRGKAATC